MKALITALLIVAMAWTSPATETPRPAPAGGAVRPQYTLVELFAVMVIVGGLVTLNVWIRWKAANAPTDSRQIWPPDTNTFAGPQLIRPMLATPDSPLCVGLLDAGDQAVVIHPDISAEGLIDTFGPSPAPFTCAFESVLESSELLPAFSPCYKVRGFVSANGVWAFLLNSTNGYVAQSYSRLDASMCATNYFPGASVGTGQEPQKFFRLAAP